MTTKATAPKDPPRAVQLEMYYFLRLTRALDERAHVLHKQGKVVGGLFSNQGQEAISIGSAFALEKGDYLGPMIRNMGAVLVRGHTPRDIMTQYLARATSPTRGKDNSQHFGEIDRTGVVPYVSMLGINVSVLGGMALGAKLKGEPRVALTYIGDGATSTGDFYEGLNVAAVQKAPLVVIIENNQYGYSTPTAKQCLLENLADKAKAFCIPGYVGDGNDVLDVWRRTKVCVDAARAGGGAQLLELKTFRMKGHAPHDNQAYVPKALLEEWRAKDPIARFEKTLKPSAAEKQDVERRVAEAVDDAVAFAESSPFPDGAEAVRGVFEDDAIVAFTPWWKSHA
ncbi:MAG TPA: thiamine pyrophosphate-dependent dehydrogenase E1 component subunit alpha [Planctomycetota bacterium]|nr:thiamine pyrophosphate-dependent dehydrogenase E1 component subunit alpha [Planctomycetota bacterium]